MNFILRSTFEGNFGIKYPVEKQIIPVLAEKVFGFRNGLDGLFPAELTVGPNNDPILKLDSVDRMSFAAAGERMSGRVHPMPKMKLFHFLGDDLHAWDFRASGLFGRLAQPHADGNYLMVCHPEGASGFLGVVSSKGKVLNKFAVASDIEGMQVTSSGKFWIRFGDEGVFRGDPIAARYVACFDGNGNHLWPAECDERFSPWTSSHNVVSEDCVWFSSIHSELHKVDGFRITQSTPSLKSWDSQFVIHANRICWASVTSFGPLPNILRPDFLVSTNLVGSEFRFYLPVGKDKKVLPRQLTATRGAKLYFVSNHDVYVVDFAKIF